MAGPTTRTCNPANPAPCWVRLLTRCFGTFLQDPAKPGLSTTVFDSAACLFRTYPSISDNASFRSKREEWKHGSQVVGAKSWEVTDKFWSRVEPLIPVRPGRVTDKPFIRKPGAGRKPKPARAVFEAIVFVLCTGCQWKALAVWVKPSTTCCGAGPPLPAMPKPAICRSTISP